MTRDDALLVVREALAIVLELDVAQLAPDASLDELGADSIARVEWAEIVEERIGRRMRFDDGDLGEFRTPGEAADYMMSRL